MQKVSIREETVTIPTYPASAPEKLPMFLERRVYQGSSGKVYPFPVTEKISDVREDRDYQAVILENEYLKVMVLPQLGGRIQRAYDKTNGYDFVYYNHVVKPALVGLLGPWISGGIEFNWPQHHRPTTFMPVEYALQEGEDGSASVLLGETDRMYGTRGTAKITLYPGKAYIEISGRLYNRTEQPQTFLWWANPAVPVNEFTKSIFPPDVTAVMDHGRRAVSSFPIATGEYYKQDYSEGVDISMYRNIKVPTSYMAARSDLDFIGNYDEEKQAGLLHVADHHIAPGKKQWTWGNADFGRSWDRNLTDSDGPYIELMTGVYTDNQPDFTWLMPHEEKSFVQVFMPYKGVGRVGNATREAAVSLAQRPDGKLELRVYVTEAHPSVKLTVRREEEIWYEAEEPLCPESCLTRVFSVPDRTSRETGSVGAGTEGYGPGMASSDRRYGTDSRHGAVQREGAGAGEVYEGSRSPAGTDCPGQNSVFCGENGPAPEGCEVFVEAEGRLLVIYKAQAIQPQPLPSPARALPLPDEIRSAEELYFAGQHLEQYRHASYSPEDYYQEGLRRDPYDSRLNRACGELLLRQGRFADSIPYLEQAVKSETRLNANPSSGQSRFALALAYEFCGQEQKAFDAYYKSVWSSDTQNAGFFALACLSARSGRCQEALGFVEESLVRNWHDSKARHLKAMLLRKLSLDRSAFLEESLALDPLCAGLLWESRDEDGPDPVRNSLQETLELAGDDFRAGFYEDGLRVLDACREESPLKYYYKGYALLQTGRVREAETAFRRGEETCPDYCFPNRLQEILILQRAVDVLGAAPMASYYLGSLFYDRKQYQEAVSCWRRTTAGRPSFAPAHRNLAIACYNHLDLPEEAMKEMGLAVLLEPESARLLLEYDQLCEKRNCPGKERLEYLAGRLAVVLERDDLYLRYLTLLNEGGAYEEVLEGLAGRNFHPWEGGEGKVAAQYRYAKTGLALSRMREGRFAEAAKLLTDTLAYPENLGEGRLPNVQDNAAEYYLGLCSRALGQEEEALRHFTKAAEGEDTPAAALYYNDQPSDYIYYLGLARRALGDEKGARKAFHKLVSFGEQHLFDKPAADFFAVSLPEIDVFQEALKPRNDRYCRVLKAYGLLGMGKTDEARLIADTILKEYEACQEAVWIRDCLTDGYRIE